MKKTVSKLSLFCVALAVMSGVALAQPANQLLNAGFESPTLGKITNGFSQIGPWENAGSLYTDSGVELLDPHSGSYRAYENQGDSGAYQIADYQMILGDQITLSWWALASSTSQPTNPPVQVVGLISSSTYGPDNWANAPIYLTVTNIALTGGWVEYTINYTAQAGDVNNYIGCYFATTTTNAFGNPTNDYGGYDDFYLGVLPSGSLPVIVTEPTSQTAYKGDSAIFTVSAVGATSYQWLKGSLSGGPFTNLTNVGQISGATTPTLTLTNLTDTNDGYYVVACANAFGTVTSTPAANLTVQSIIYEETFTVTKPNNNQSITNVGWFNDIAGTYNNRIFSNGHGINLPFSAVYSYDNVAIATNPTDEAFYYTSASANGGPYDTNNLDGNGPITNKEVFPGMNLATVQNLGYAATVNNAAGTIGNWMVKVNNSWYVSTNQIIATGVQTLSMNFNPAAGAWSNLTVTGTGSFIEYNTNVVVGPATTSPLTGYVTGGGILVRHPNTQNFQFNDYVVLGAIPPSTMPVISAPPFTQTNYTATTATFSVSANTNGTTAGLTYQWEDGTVGSGLYSPLSNGGQFSGVTTPTLTITNVTSAANHKDYVVEVTDGAGTVTSSPPATLWVVDAAPILTSDTIMYPDDAPDLGSVSNTITAGNHNVMNLTASFVGDLPITYQWQYSTNDGATMSNINGATNSTLSLSNISTNASGYYRSTASNSQGGPNNSDWVALTVYPASTAQVQWDAKVPFSGDTASQILSGDYGSFFEAEALSDGQLTGDVYVTNGIGGTNVFVFDTVGNSATLVGGYTPLTGQFSGTTGDTNLDSVLNDDTESDSGATVTLNNLVVSNTYTAQLFCFANAGSLSRQANFSPTNNTADVSQSFTMGDTVYVAGTFMATTNTETFYINGDAGCYICCVVVYNTLAVPTVSIAKVGSTLQVTYANGVLEQATSLIGPWTTNNNASPYTFTPASSNLFFRAEAP
ncbi:MAG: hypothetical protein ABR955_04015 [Verrucomicrobiota bacterium]|jgi:hypothetical protein